MSTRLRELEIGSGGERVRLRSVAVADLPAIVAIERQSFSDPWSTESFRSALGRPEFFFTAAELESVPAGLGAAPGAAIAGYVLARFVVGEGEVANIAVRPECRGRGVGASLLDATLHEARARKVGAVFLEVRESNVLARALYTSRGFHVVGRRRRYYRRPVEDALILRRELGQGDV